MSNSQAEMIQAVMFSCSRVLLLLSGQLLQHSNAKIDSPEHAKQSAREIADLLDGQAVCLREVSRDV